MVETEELILTCLQIRCLSTFFAQAHYWLGCPCWGQGETPVVRCKDWAVSLLQNITEVWIWKSFTHIRNLKEANILPSLWTYFFQTNHICPHCVLYCLRLCLVALN